MPAHDPFEMMGKNADDFDWVKGPPGHDRRYAIDSTKLQTESAGARRTTINFEEGLKQTIDWYPANEAWWRPPRRPRPRPSTRRRASRKGKPDVSNSRRSSGGAHEHPWMLVLTCRCTAIPAAGSRRTGSALQLGRARPTWAPQNNISFNAERGVTRGIHAEPWTSTSRWQRDRFGAWVDLRPGELRRGLHVRHRPVQGHLRAPRRGQLPSRPRGRHGTRTW